VVTLGYPRLLAPDRYQWNVLVQEYSWLRALEGCPQDARHHAEGDVHLHTSMVVAALLALPEWADLTQTERAQLFAAALLHDVAKPACTTRDEDGSIHSPGHARLGERMAREILAVEAAALPFRVTEGVCKLVRYHGLPLWSLEKPDPERAVVEASLVSDTRLLAMLAEADVWGRICEDQQELLDRIELFRELCREKECYGRPREFASDHTRFRYFRKGDRCLDFEIFDDTTFEVTLLSGLPGAGKDTWARRHLPGMTVLSMDQMRTEMGIDPRRNQYPVARAAQERAKEYLRRRESFVWNATNLTRRIREPLVDLFYTYGARTHIVYLPTPLPRVLAQNRQREDVVPEDAIFDLLRKQDIPDLTEAHRVSVIE
jgi:predicted kinase